MERKSIIVKVTFENGDSLVTSINTDLEGAKKYYITGEPINIGIGPNDNCQKAIKVEEV